MSRSLSDWLTLLERLHPKEVDLSLDRIGVVWERLGRVLPAKRIFVVAGTNGKGSTVATISALLDSLGYRHGSYTSPHIHDYNERVQVNGQPVTDGMLVAAFERIEAMRGDTSLSYFEFGTLAAFLILAEHELDYAVMEIGLGGRLDAVNLLDADCAVITPIGLDHQEYLGETLQDIGFEKAGIIRPGRPLICGEPQPPDSVLTVARNLGAAVLRLGVDFNIEPSGAGVTFSIGDAALALPLPKLAGPHQMGNMATALAAVVALVPEAMEQAERLAEGLGQVDLHGRFEQVRQAPAIWIDVGHNLLGAQAIASTLATAGRNRTIRCVFAMLIDKDVQAVAAALSESIDQWYCGGLKGGRGQSSEELAQRLEQVVDSECVRRFSTVTAALSAAISDSKPDDGILVFGSFLTADEAMLALESHR